MGQSSAETDMGRAANLRKLGKSASSAKAKGDFNTAADRLEERAARKAKKLGRRTTKSVQTYMR